jgi:hypothetical protein
MGVPPMKRNVLFAAVVAPSALFWASIAWSNARPAEPLPMSDANDNMCRADQGESVLASIAPRAGEPSEKVPRERVFGAPVTGVLHKGVIDAAKDLLDLPMGSEVILEVDGTSYGFRLEPHYHPPGFEGGPVGWHKGVTVYELEERDSF